MEQTLLDLLDSAITEAEKKVAFMDRHGTPEQARRAREIWNDLIDQYGDEKAKQRSQRASTDNAV